MPGIKIGRSRAQLPLKVEVEEITVPEGFVQTLNDHLLLVYTGKTRLARNLLQVSPTPGGREAEGSGGPKPSLQPSCPIRRMCYGAGMPGCLPSWRMPTAWCSTPKSVQKPSAKVRCFLPEDKDTRSECLVAHRSEARGLCRLSIGTRY